MGDMAQKILTSNDARVFNGLNLSTDSLDIVPFYRHLEKNGLVDDYD